MVPTPAMACTLPSLVRTRIGASPPRPKCENSTTLAASMVATPASTALPPWKYMRMPASVAYSDPPATAPCVPRDGSRTGTLPPLRPLAQDHRRQQRHRDHQSEFHMVPIVGDWNAAGRIRGRRYNLVIRERDRTRKTRCAAQRGRADALLPGVLDAPDGIEVQADLCARCGYYMSCADYY